uniref:(R)-citramalate synthase n=1 Tax=Timspurckia oligopyrenoides TaxID=708627 RepID=A0A7S1ES51_9RHOD|mmetsp:Transcript_4242/g.7436  ORF Transcript_4242/g.7436 Transcript_4242/m.7436 type:complete len:663 (+) Transcript_4242:129-2117(+)
MKDQNPVDSRQKVTIYGPLFIGCLSSRSFKIRSNQHGSIGRQVGIQQQQSVPKYSVLSRGCRSIILSVAGDHTPKEAQGSVAEKHCTGLSKVSIYDTTLRDGSQGEGISFSVEDKIRIMKRLDEFGVDYIEGGWPGSNPKDAAFFDAARNITLRHSRLAAFGSTRYKKSTCENDANIQALLHAETSVVTLVGKASAFQVTDVLGATLDENLAMIADSVKYLVDRGREVMLDAEHFFDGFRADKSYAMKCLNAAADAGASSLVLCDTNGGSLPWQIEEITRSVVEEFRSRGIRIGIHCHNDMELAVANSISAVHAGATVVQGTVNGYGERTGNANLVSIIPSLHLKMKAECLAEADQLKMLTSLSRYVDELANQPHVGSRPFVGSSAFAHKGGLHVAAVMKNEDSYQHIDPTVVGNVRRVLVSELSGRGNIVSKMNELGIELNVSNSSGKEASTDIKTQSGQILERVKQLENCGYTFEGAEGSVELMIRRAMSSYSSPFELVDFNVVTGSRYASSELDPGASHGAGSASANIPFGDSSVSQAVVRLNLITTDSDSTACVIKQRLEVGEGNGPVDALNSAMRKALLLEYPSLKSMILTDYKVRILDNESATAATTRVMISFADKESKESWTTVSAHPNIIVASINALVDGFEYAMLSRQPTCLQ